MDPRFEQFIRERQFLSNVTPATVEWYRNSLRLLNTPSPSQNDLKDAVLRMREKGAQGERLQFRNPGPQLLRTLGERPMKSPITPNALIPPSSAKKNQERVHFGPAANNIGPHQMVNLRDHRSTPHQQDQGFPGVSRDQEHNHGGAPHHP